MQFFHKRGFPMGRLIYFIAYQALKYSQVATCIAISNAFSSEILSIWFWKTLCDCDTLSDQYVYLTVTKFHLSNAEKILKTLEMLPVYYDNIKIQIAVGYAHIS